VPVGEKQTFRFGPVAKGACRFGGPVEGGKSMRKHTIRFAAVVTLLLGLIAPAVWSQNTVQTIGGGGPNNLPALKSSLGSPAGVAVDGAGNVFVADLSSQRAFKVDTTGNVTVLAGNGAFGANSAALGEGVPAISAYFAYLSGVAVDSSGNIFIADGFLCEILEVSAQTGKISTVAGSMFNCWYSGDGGPATSAALNDPFGVAVDKSGNIFIADTTNCLVRVVSAQTGNISTLAGTPPNTTTGLLRCGYSGDGSAATSAKLENPAGVAVDVSGNVFIADTSNCAIREVSVQTGIISTVAGTGTCSYSGDGGPATSATLNDPFGVAVDSSGSIFIADTSNCVIRKVSSSNAHISTAAGDYSTGCGYSGDGGSAASAQLNRPYGVAVDSSEDILIADYGNSVIREVSASTGNISTFAGVAVPDPNQAGQMIGFPAYSGDGYPATEAELGFLHDAPWSAGLFTDNSGNVFIADTANSVIREISASTGIISTVAGNGFVGFSGDGGPATGAELFYPRDVAVDGIGNIFIVDSGNCVIRKVTASTGIISTVAGTPPDSSGNYYCDFSGDGGPATSAELYPIDLLSPAGGVAVDASGDIFIADTGNNVIREVSAATGIITTIAGVPTTVIYPGSGDGGPATSAMLDAPYEVAVDSAGNVFLTDTYNYAIREVMAVNGNIYSVAGNMGLGRGFSGDGGPATAAQIGFAFGLFLDPAGNLFIPDADHCVIREVSASTGLISTVAGTPNPSGIYYCGYAGDGGPALSAIFDNPGAAGADASGDLVVLDDIRVRTVAGLVQGSGAGVVAFPNPLAFPTTQPGTSETLTVMFSNRGSLQTSVSTVAISGTNASDFSETDNCASHSLAAGGGSCAINVKFTPSAGGTESALLTMTDTAGTQTVNLSGAGIDFSVTAASGGSLSATVTQGQTATYLLQVTAIGGASSSDQVSVTIACAGAPSQAVCSSTPQPVVATVSTPGALTVSVTTTSPTLAVALPLSGLKTPAPPGVLLVGVVLLLAFWLYVEMRSSSARGRRCLAWLALTAPIVLAIILAVGCGSSPTQPPPQPVGGTPTGTYTLMLTAMSGSDSHTIKLTLIVNAASGVN
jgi:trimeric autotransporter adhesin